MALLNPSVLNYCAVYFATRSSPLKVFCIQNVLEDLEGHTGNKRRFVSCHFATWYIYRLNQSLPEPGSLLELWLNLLKFNFQLPPFFSFFSPFCNVYNSVSWSFERGLDFACFIQESDLHHEVICKFDLIYQY